MVTRANGNGETKWYALDADACTGRLGVDPAVGLSADETARRLDQYGPNRLAEEEKEPRWLTFVRQYKDYMQIILLVAAAGSVIVGDMGSAVMLVLLTVVNATLALRQEGKAEESVAALRKMLKMSARVRRDGGVVEVPAEELVPGDVALFEAGDRVPADGRLVVAATLEIEEAALTGESTPVLKETAAIAGDDVPLGDRVNLAFMNSNVTRGRGEMLVTGTGMATEVGHIAGMLQTAEDEKTPLTRQIDRLTLIIAGLAGLALVAIILIGLRDGDSFDELFVVAIALAIAAIPTGMPLVVTTVLAIGTTTLASRNAIVKRLPSVETLGSTSAICSDKTGTLTLNQMTARQLLVAGRRYSVTGEGYETTGQIRHVGGLAEADLDPVLLPMALCSDASVSDGELVGDPTEGALVVLAAKGGLDIRGTRAEFPRVAEVPFDSAYKFMATFHEMTGADGRRVVRCYVKGAPDVLIDRTAHLRGPDGQALPFADELRETALTGNERLAGEGMRVMIVAERDLDPAAFDPDADLLGHVESLTLLAMVGIVDPPRPEAKVAIAETRSAGIRVRMITGDHAATAAAIAGELGIEGRAITGAEFGAMSDAEVVAKIDEIGVIARVAPEDKVRLVDTLKSEGNIVAMTGDGVNDAPALKAANIGVAMGITGTDVSKEAADMILTDDNFATIVGAVEQGRIIYDNLLKYIRFQMAGLGAFILAFLGSALLGIAGTALFLPLQILWINFVIQAPIGTALGLDTPTPGLMDDKPRPPSEPIITRSTAIRLTIASVLQAALTLRVYSYVDANYSGAADPSQVARTAALATFSIIHIPLALNLRYPRDTVLRLESLSNGKLLIALGFAFLVTVLATEIGLLQRILDTVPLGPRFWAISIVVAVVWLLLGEVVKWIYRRVSDR